MELSKQELIQAAVLLHPTYVTVDDIKGKVVFGTFKDNCNWSGSMVHALTILWFPLAGVKVPIAILGAEDDFLTPPALVKQFEEILASKPEVEPLLLQRVDKVFIKSLTNLTLSGMCR